MKRIEPRNFGRKDERFKIALPGTMTGAGGEKRVSLLDISQAGALVHCAKPPAVHEWVDLRCGMVAARAQVCWVTEPRFGVKFLEPLDKNLVDTVSKAPPD